MSTPTEYRIVKAELQRVTAELAGLRGGLHVPRHWVHVPHGPEHVTANQADADYLRSAARNIKFARCLGSNLTATVTRLLDGLADQLTDADR